MHDLWLTSRVSELRYAENVISELRSDVSIGSAEFHAHQSRSLLQYLFSIFDTISDRYCKDKSIQPKPKNWKESIEVLHEHVPLPHEIYRQLLELLYLRNKITHGERHTSPGPELLDWFFNFLLEFLRDQYGLKPDSLQVKAQNVHLPEFDALTFVHRKAQLDLLHELLLGSNPERTVAIVGAPAIGKSELALCFAHATSRHFTDGTVWVDAAELDTDFIIHRLLETLGNTLGKKAGTQPAWATWKNYLSNKNLLIVIDNADDFDVNKVRPIGKICTTILTMRNRYLAQTALRLPQRAIIELPPLDEDESIDLLRRRLLRPLDESDLPRAREIARTLGGLPLALCMAADLLNQTEGLSLAEYASVLPRAPLDYLTPHPGVGVRVAFEVSLRYIERDGPALKNLFASLGVCLPGGFSVDAARAVAEGIMDEVRIGLSRLASLSLLRFDKGRYTFQPLIREFAQDLAKDLGLFEEAQRRYIAYFLTLVASHPAKEPSSLSLLEPDVEGILGAAQWLLGQPEADLQEWREFWRNIRDILETRAYHDEAIHLMETAFELARKASSEATGDPSLLASAHELEAYYAAQLGKFYDRAGHSEDAIKILEHALELEEDRERIRKVRNSLATAKRHIRDHRGALEILRKTLESEEEQSNESRAFTLNTYGRTLLAYGQPREALQYLEQALQLEEEPPKDLRSKAITLAEMGRALRKLRRYTESVRSFEESLRLSKTYDDNPRTLSINHNEIAEALCMIGQHVIAVTHSIEALRFSSSLRDPRSRTISRRRFARVLKEVSMQAKRLQHDDKWAEALPLTQAWVTGEQELKFSRGEFWALIDLGNVNSKLGKPEDALTAYSNALENAERRGDVLAKAIACQAKGKALQRQTKWAEALPLVQAWLTCQRELNSPKDEFWALIDLGNIYGNLGKSEDALAAYSNALENAERRSELRERMIATARLAKELQAQGKWAEALTLAQAWVAGAQEIDTPMDEFQALMDLGNICSNLGKPEDALAAYSSALENAERRGDVRGKSLAREFKEHVVAYLNSTGERKPPEEELVDLTRDELHQIQIGDVKGICRVLSDKIRLFRLLDRQQEAKCAVESMAARLPDDPQVHEQLRLCKGNIRRAKNLKVGLRRKVKRIIVNRGFGFLFPEPSSEEADIYFNTSVVEGDTSKLQAGAQVLVDYYILPDGKLAANRLVPLEHVDQENE